MSGESPAEDQTGLYRRIKCYHCGYSIDLLIPVILLPTHRRRGKGLIESILTDQEYEKYRKFKTEDKITFSVGRYFDIYGKKPSGHDLSDLTGLTPQTVSRILNSSKVTRYVVGEQQEKRPDGRFDEKRFYLTDEGKPKYGELTYNLKGISGS
jgi:hypothetical protein